MDFSQIHTRNYFMSVALFLTALFTLLEPEGSVETSALLRLVQWLLQVSVPLVMLVLVHLLLSRSITFDHLGPWWKLSISGLLGGVLFTPVALALDFAFGIDAWPVMDHSMHLFQLFLDEMVGVVPPILVVWLGINAPRVLRLDFSEPLPASAEPARKSAFATDSPQEKTETPISGLLQQLPTALGQDIVYLMSELHYLRVVTTTGNALVLYSLRDAVDELGGAGTQTHRAFWAAFAHIEKIVTRNGRTELLMRDGSLVPVSRRQASRVKREIAQRLN